MDPHTHNNGYNWLIPLAIVSLAVAQILMNIRLEDVELRTTLIRDRLLGRFEEHDGPFASESEDAEKEPVDE